MKNQTPIPTTEQLQELVSYLPMLRRMASFEASYESVPARLERVDVLVGKLADVVESYWKEDSEPAFERPSDEPLPDGARLRWTQQPGALEAIDEATLRAGHDGFVEVRQRFTEEAERRRVAASVA